MQDFERIYQEHGRGLYRFLCGLLHTEHEATELLQETFLAFFREQRKEPMPQEKQRPWLYKVAKHKALNLLRQRRPQQELTESQRSTAATPEAALSKEQERHLVQQVLGQMKEREAHLLRLYAAGLRYKEIAEVTGLETSSISKTLVRAKRAFKVLYESALRNPSYRGC